MSRLYDDSMRRARAPPQKPTLVARMCVGLGFLLVRLSRRLIEVASRDLEFKLKARVVEKVSPTDWLRKYSPQFNKSTREISLRYGRVRMKI